MRRSPRPMTSVSIVGLLVLGVFACGCRFSFAEAKRPDKDTITFGAKKKPEVLTSPQLESFRSVFADVAEKVIPTVVSITSTKIDTIVFRNPYRQFFWGAPFDEFFGSPHGQREPDQAPRKERQEERRTSGVGSGVIVSTDGYVLTNSHVVAHADEIVVELHDEREFEAEIIGVDTLSDVAVIKLKGEVADLPVAYLGDSHSLRPGDWVMAIGNPFNLSSTVTTGIVSALGRHTNGITMYQNFIQTDAAINPGNSGGALVSIDGELIGINTMIYTRSGGYMGIGFAIPINMAKRIMEQIIYHGTVSRGWLGVQIGDVDQNMKEALGLKSRNGVLVNDVFDGQPARKAGIKSGDVILSIDGVRTGDANELRNTVASISPGKKVPVVLIRDGREMTVQVTLDERDEGKIGKMTAGDPDDSSEKEPEVVDVSRKIGMSVGNITADVRSRLGLGADVKGVVVLKVDPASWAARKGLRKDDIIRKVKVSKSNFLLTTDTKTFRGAVGKAKKGDSILLYVVRKTQSFFVAFKIE